MSLCEEKRTPNIKRRTLRSDTPLKLKTYWGDHSFSFSDVTHCTTDSLKIDKEMFERRDTKGNEICESICRHKLVRRTTFVCSLVQRWIQLKKGNIKYAIYACFADFITFVSCLIQVFWNIRSEIERYFQIRFLLFGYWHLHFLYWHFINNARYIYNISDILLQHMAYIFRFTMY